MPAMNWARPPKSPTKGKKRVGDESVPHHCARYEDMIQVELAKPASPRAAGGAMGRRTVCTTGVCAWVSVSPGRSSSSALRWAMAVGVW